LFGTSSIQALSTVAEKNTYGEVTRYTYPTDGSVLGQMVIGANLSNMLPTDQCVRKYTNCLKRDSVCGENFELCTSFKEFRNQGINCASTLARCQSDGLIELFGSTNTVVAPKATSRIGTLISDGAQYAAANAVKTCYKTVDACLVNACTANPWRCIQGVNMEKINIADFIAGGTTDENTTTSTLASNPDGMITSDVNLYETTGQDVRKFVKGKCLNTIGGSKACYMTFLEKTPRDRDLADIDNQEDVFSLAYGARKEYANTTIQDILKNFDKRAKANCIKTISDCARRSCGGGLGSACYKGSRTSDGVHVNNDTNYNDIKSGCEAIVNTDANCQYAANSANEDGYIYQFADNSVFNTLFPKYEDAATTNSDPIGAVASLNALLSTSYNDAAIAQMKKQCANTAISCVKSLCGKDYVNCYRNRTDVKTNVYNTGSTAFDNSMNKVGGVLDYTIVTGLCMNAVKSADVCDEHLRAEAVTLAQDQVSSTWGTNTVRNAWLTSADSISVKQDIVVGCKTKTGGEYCDENAIAECNTVDEDGCLYDQPVSQSWAEYSITQSAKNLFQEVLMDIEKEAQAKYNSKLTQEQHMCLSSNEGGILGRRDNGSALQWVKLKSTKVPKNYETKGLSASQFTTSNDLYGSFCRAKITVMSDDKDIQDNLGSDAVAYFAAGDPFVCGSWISQKKLETISDIVGKRARKDAGEGSVASKWAKWGGSGLVGLLSAVGGYAGMDAIQRGESTLGGLLNPSKNEYRKTEDKKEAAKSCLKYVDSARSQYAKANTISAKQTKADEYNKAVEEANKALRVARGIDSDKNQTIKNISFEYARYTQGEAGTTNTSCKWNDDLKADIEGAITKLESAESNACGPLCQEPLKYLKTLLNGTPTADDVATAREYWDLALARCYKSGNDEKALKKKCDDAVNPFVASGAFSSRLVTCETKTEGAVAEDFNIPPYFESRLNEIANFCQQYENVIEDTKHRRNVNLIAGAVTGAAGFGLSVAAISAAQQIKYENAENAAAKEWLENVGSKIKCYLGAEELGSYGDVISFTLE
jgi:hypothetical protein